MHYVGGGGGEEERKPLLSERKQNLVMLGRAKPITGSSAT